MAGDFGASLVGVAALSFPMVSTLMVTLLAGWVFLLLTRRCSVRDAGVGAVQHRAGAGDRAWIAGVSVIVPRVLLSINFISTVSGCAFVSRTLALGGIKGVRLIASGEIYP